MAVGQLLATLPASGRPATPPHLDCGVGTASGSLPPRPHLSTSGPGSPPTSLSRVCCGGSSLPMSLSSGDVPSCPCRKCPGGFFPLPGGPLGPTHWRLSVQDGQRGRTCSSGCLTSLRCQNVAHTSVKGVVVGGRDQSVTQPTPSLVANLRVAGLGPRPGGLADEARTVMMTGAALTGWEGGTGCEQR